MFKVLEQTKDVGKAISGLSQDGWMGIAQSGLIIGFLKVSMWVSKLEGPANLFSINGLYFDYYHWGDFPSYVKNEIKNLNMSPQVDKGKWQEAVTNFGTQKRIDYCTCLALLLERHMKNSYNSPNNAQTIAMIEIEQILAGNINVPTALTSPIDEGDRLDYYVTLHAGEKPIIQVNFSDFALSKYFGRLEGVMAYSAINMIKMSLGAINEPHRTFLEDLVFNEHLAWQKELPKVGLPADWNWLPRFV